MMKQKIQPRNKLATLLKEHRECGARVVFTNGCFDILHAGHVRYLAEAKALGDLLVIGVNSDTSVQIVKGPLRPIVPEADRMVVLAALECTDYVTLFDEETPAKLVEELAPDVLVKGRDYAGKVVVGREDVESRGGRVVLIPLVSGRGTTSIISRIIERHVLSEEEELDI